MLLVNFHKVIELDEEIATAQKTLMDLYRQRLSIVKPAPTSVRRPFYSEPVELSFNDYDFLKAIWAERGIAIPEPKKLEDKFAKFHRLVEEVAATEPAIAQNLKLLLVPPAKKIQLPLTKEARTGQKFITKEDLIDQKLLPQVKKSNKWRVLAVYGGKEGIYIDKPQRLLEEKKYIIGGYDMRALGITEYLALTLQENYPLDDGTWTMLYGQYAPGSPLPQASFKEGQYRIETGEVESVFGDDRFRPTYELT